MLNLVIVNASVCKLACFWFIFLALVDQGRSLQCWVCSSPVDGGYCGDPFNTTHLWKSPCPLERFPTPDPYYGVYIHRPDRHPVCKKVIQKERGQLMMIRSCGYESRKNEACNPDGDRTFTDDVQFCDTCDSDGCNSASFPGPALWLFMSSLITVTFLYF